MYIEIRNPNSPGTMLNDNTDHNIVYFMKFIEKLGDSKMDYKTFQKNMAENKITTESYIRSSFPFYKYAGLINDYTIIDKNLFTKLGKAFYDCLDTLYTINDIFDEDAQKLYKQFNDLKITIAQQALNNLINNKSCGYGIVFRKILNFLYEYESITEQEFALIIAQLSNDSTVPIEKTKDIITNNRNHSDSITFKVKSINKTTNQTQLISKTNCFSYFMGTLEYSGYTVRDGYRYYLNKTTEDSIQKMYGGIYE